MGNDTPRNSAHRGGRSYRINDEDTLDGTVDDNTVGEYTVDTMDTSVNTMLTDKEYGRSRRGDYGRSRRGGGVGSRELFGIFDSMCGTVGTWVRDRSNNSVKHRGDKDDYYSDDDDQTMDSYLPRAKRYPPKSITPKIDPLVVKNDGTSNDNNNDPLSNIAATPSSTKPLASSFARRCYFTKAGVDKITQHYEGLTLTGNTILMLAGTMKLKGCPTICDEDLRRVEQSYPNQFSRLPDELLLSSGWRRISKYCHFSGKPIPDGVPFFHSRERAHPSTGGFVFLLAASIGMVRSSDVEPLNLDTLVVLQTDYPHQCDRISPELIEKPEKWMLVEKFCFFSGGPINAEEDVYYTAILEGNQIFMLAFLSPSLTPEELYRITDVDASGMKKKTPFRTVGEVEAVERAYDLAEQDFSDLQLYHLGPCRALPPFVLQPTAWSKILPRRFVEARERALASAYAIEMAARVAAPLQMSDGMQRERTSLGPTALPQTMMPGMGDPTIIQQEDPTMGIDGGNVRGIGYNVNDSLSSNVIDVAHHRHDSLSSQMGVGVGLSGSFEGHNMNVQQDPIVQQGNQQREEGYVEFGGGIRRPPQQQQLQQQQQQQLQMQEQGAQHQGIQQQEMQQQIQIQKQQPTIFANGRWMNQQDEINQQEYGGMVQQDFGGVDQQENRGMNQQGISMMAPLQGIQQQQQQQQQQQHQHSQYPPIGTSQGNPNQPFQHALLHPPSPLMPAGQRRLSSPLVRDRSASPHVRAQHYGNTGNETADDMGMGMRMGVGRRMEMEGAPLSPSVASNERILPPTPLPIFATGMSGVQQHNINTGNEIDSEYPPVQNKMIRPEYPSDSPGELQLDPPDNDFDGRFSSHKRGKEPPGVRGLGNQDEPGLISIRTPDDEYEDPPVRAIRNIETGSIDPQKYVGEGISSMGGNPTSNWMEDAKNLSRMHESNGSERSDSEKMSNAGSDANSSIRTSGSKKESLASIKDSLQALKKRGPGKNKIIERYLANKGHITPVKVRQAASDFESPSPAPLYPQSPQKLFDAVKDTTSAIDAPTLSPQKSLNGSPNSKRRGFSRRSKRFSPRREIKKYSIPATYNEKTGEPPISEREIPPTKIDGALEDEGFLPSLSKNDQSNLKKKVDKPNNDILDNGREHISSSQKGLNQTPNNNENTIDGFIDENESVVDENCFVDDGFNDQDEQSVASNAKSSYSVKTTMRASLSRRFENQDEDEQSEASHTKSTYSVKSIKSAALRGHFGNNSSNDQDDRSVSTDTKSIYSVKSTRSAAMKGAQELLRKNRQKRLMLMARKRASKDKFGLDSDLISVVTKDTSSTSLNDTAPNNEHMVKNRAPKDKFGLNSDLNSVVTKEESSMPLNLMVKKRASKDKFGLDSDLISVVTKEEFSMSLDDAAPNDELMAKTRESKDELGLNNDLMSVVIKEESTTLSDKHTPSDEFMAKKRVLNDKFGLDSDLISVATKEELSPDDELMAKEMISNDKFGLDIDLEPVITKEAPSMSQDELLNSRHSKSQQEQKHTFTATQTFLSPQRNSSSHSGRNLKCETDSNISESTSFASESTAYTEHSSPMERTQRRSLILQMAKNRMRSSRNKPAPSSTRSVVGIPEDNSKEQEEEER